MGKREWNSAPRVYVIPLCKWCIDKLKHVTMHIMQSLWLNLQEYLFSIKFLAVDSQWHTYWHVFLRNCGRGTIRCLLLNIVRAVQNIKAVHEMCLNIWIPSANTKTLRKRKRFHSSTLSSSGIENMSEFFAGIIIQNSWLLLLGKLGTSACE